jgi:pyruvate kinase
MTDPHRQLAVFHAMLNRLQVEIGKREQAHRAALEAVDPSLRGSARNFLAFLALRDNSPPALRESFETLGMQFPAAQPAHINTGMQRARWLLEALAGVARTRPLLHGAQDLGLERRSDDLLGRKRKGFSSHILVTLPDSAVTDRKVVKDLIDAGMTVARINCAQKERRQWKEMIRNVRHASREAGLPCRILMDLSGPKLRTGQMVPGPRVAHLRPRRDILGRSAAPAVVWLCPPSSCPQESCRTIIPVPRRWLAGIRRGDRIAFVDARGKKRRMIAGRGQSGGRPAEIHETAYVQTGMRLDHVDRNGRHRFARIGTLPRVEMKITLRPGDILVVHKDPRPGEPARRSSSGKVLRPAHISCTLPEVFGCVKSGDPVMFDNGIIQGVVQKKSTREFQVRIVRTAGEERTLRADKGINLPHTIARTPGLTAKDRRDLGFAVAHADLVSLSFVRTARDVEELQDSVERVRGKKPGIVIKIETSEAVRQLPAIVLATMRRPRSGIMMARGDLAVEYGWERLADLEATLLAMCRAAQLPFFVATEILETMTRRGVPSRAEIIDAATASRAQGVLLNKGPHLVAATRMLGRILRTTPGYPSDYFFFS